MLVKDIMTTDVIKVTSSTTLSEAAKIMVDNGITGLPVMDENGKIIAMITKSSIVEFSLPSALHNTGDVAETMIMKSDEYLNKLKEVSRHTVGTIAVKKSIIFASPDMGISEVAARMYGYGFRRLPVLDENEKLVGIVSYTDIAAVIAEKK